MQGHESDFIRERQKFGRRLDWNLLKTFHDIVQANGITAAANVGWSKQSTISLALKRLEEILGSRLCQRGRGGFELTDEGRVLYENVRNIYKSVEIIPTTLSNTKQSISGTLKIAVISNFASDILDGIFINYGRRYPDVVVTLDVMPWDSISSAILNNDYDIGITPIADRHDELKYIPLTREYHRIFCGARHPMFRKTPNIKALSDMNFVLTGSDEPDSLTMFRLQHRLGHKVTARTPNLEEAKRLTIAGVGICILPEEFAARDVATGLLWPLVERSEAMSCDIFAITNSFAPKRIAKEVFMEDLIEKSPSDELGWMGALA